MSLCDYGLHVCVCVSLSKPAVCSQCAESTHGEGCKILQVDVQELWGGGGCTALGSKRETRGSCHTVESMAQADSGPLTTAGRELMRNRIIAQSEATDMAVGKPGEDPPVWLESSDWRLKLGAASALSHKGAPQLAGAPEIRAALESSEEARQLIRRTLCAAEETEPRAVQLLQSEDWRLRRGALEALRRQEAPVFRTDATYRGALRLRSLY